MVLKGCGYEFVRRDGKRDPAPGAAPLVQIGRPRRLEPGPAPPSSERTSPTDP